MNRKAYIIFIILFALASLIVSLLLLPDREEIALMLMQDKHYEEAYEKYQKLYQENMHSSERAVNDRSVAISLAELEMDFAHPYQAMQILQALVARHPHDLPLWLYMRDFYEFIEDPYLQLLSLREVGLLQPSQRNLEEQYELSLFYNDVPQQKKILEQIVGHYHANEEQYTTLAYLYASEVDSRKALETIDDMLAKHSLKELNLYSIEFAIDILGSNNKNNEAFVLANKYLDVHRTPAVATGLAYHMERLKMYDEGIALLDRLPPDQQWLEEPVEMRIDLLTNGKRVNEAFEVEKQYYLAGHHEDKVIENLLSLALESHHEDFVEDFLQKPGPPLHLSESLIISILREALYFKRLGFAWALKERMEEKYLQEHPFIDYLFFITFLPTSGHRDYFQTIDPEEQAIITLFYYQIRNPEGAKHYIQEIKNFSALDEATLLDLFFVSYEYQEAPLALKLAEIINHRFPTLQNQKYLAEAYLLNHNPLKALEIIVKLQREKIPVGDLYIEALIGAAKADSSYRPLLHQAILHRLATQPLSRDEQANMAYILQEYGYKEDAALVFRGIISLISLRELTNEKVFELYIDALSVVKDQKKILQLFTYLFPKETNISHLKKLGQLASDLENYYWAEKIYAKAHELKPCDNSIIKLLALTLVSLGKNTEASIYLKLYLAHVPCGDYLVNYNYGQMLSFQNREKEAQIYYQRALGQVLRKKTKDQEAKSTEAQLYYLTKNYCRAIRSYEHILQNTPDNIAVRVDFVNMLLDLQRYSDARMVLSTSSFAEKEKDQRNLEIARARYWKEKRRLRIATKRANELIASYPRSGDAFIFKAHVEQDIGRWRSALAHVEQAEEMEPYNENFQKAWRDIFRDYRALQIIGGEYRVTRGMQGGGVEEIDRYGRLQLSRYIYPYTKLTVKAEFDELFVKNFVNTEGETFNFNGLRHREEMHLMHHRLNGDTWIASLYYAPGVFGEGLNVTFLDYYGFSNILMEYHRPNWDFPQTTIEQGSRDRFRLARHQRIGTSVDFDAAAAIQQYNLKGVSCAVSTYAFQALLTYKLPKYEGIGSVLGDGGEISLNYSLDAEFYMKLRTFIDKQGNPFNPIPFFNRADHRFFVSCTKKFNRSWEAVVYAGYLYDSVFGGKWPAICGATLNIGSGDYYRLHLQYLHDVSIAIQNSVVDSFIINLDLVY